MLARFTLSLFVTLGFLVSLPYVSAEMVTLTGPTDATVIDPHHEAWYFGTLENSPHTFMLYLDEPLDAHFEIVVPARNEAIRKQGAIIVKQATRGVTEVARLNAEDAAWERFFNISTGDSWQRGGSYNGSLEPGIYIIEVHSPDNQGVYALRFGEGGSLAGGGYFKKLSSLYQIKQLEGKSVFSMVLSPYLYVPLLLLMAGLGFFMYRKRYA